MLSIFTNEKDRQHKFRKKFKIWLVGVWVARRGGGGLGIGGGCRSDSLM